jgi:hypothetical protein
MARSGWAIPGLCREEEDFSQTQAVLVNPARRSTPSIRLPYLRRHFLSRVGRGADQVAAG